MKRRDPFETEILEAYESGNLESIATKAELARLREAARATAVKDRRVNIRMSAGDLRDIQVKAMQEGMPYQTLIASVLHKYVTGRLEERKPEPSRRAAESRRTSPRNDRH
ncbi:MAG: hypothetical protein H3C59_00610 [Burkholderiaceae bacterium]|nr:hypothetical protein [Burkholderiaceae bacterium]MCD6674324.1 hypothetical protein [Burkholderiaceae bacterium]